METVNVHDAKTHLSQLLERVSGGDEIVIAKAGKPVAKLVPLGADKAKRKLGRLTGKIDVPDDFDAPLPADALTAFEGR